MTNSQLWLLAALMVPIYAYSATPETIMAVQKCESTPCLLMEIDYPESSVPKGQAVGSGYSVYSLPVNGRLGDEARIIYALSVKSYTDGIECSHVGQASVAVQGMKNGHPLLKTDRGAFEVTDKALSVGCQDCLRLINKKTGANQGSFITPSWDLSRLNVERVYLNARGQARIMSEGHCIGLGDSGEYAREESKQCLSDGLFALPDQGFTTIQSGDETWHRYDIKALPFYVDIVNLACS
jgi:hypothetical protein